MLSLIRELDFARVADLSEQFGISEVTVRSDLAQLEQRGAVQRVHGGAVFRAAPSRFERSFEEEAGTAVAEKAAIGRSAAAMVRSGDTVMLDVGTTCAAVADALVRRSDLSQVVVITNGLNIALAFERVMPRFTVVVTGGTLRPLQHSLVDPLGGLVLEQLHADLFFLGCNGIDSAAGVTNVNLPEAEMKRRMVASAQRTIVVGDGAKLGHVSVARICGIDDVAAVITGASASPESIEDLKDSGLDVQVAT